MMRDTPGPVPREFGARGYVSACKSRLSESTSPGSIGRLGRRPTIGLPRTPARVVTMRWDSPSARCRAGCTASRRLLYTTTAYSAPVAGRALEFTEAVPSRGVDCKHLWPWFDRFRVRHGQSCQAFDRVQVTDLEQSLTRALAPDRTTRERRRGDRLRLVRVRGITESTASGATGLNGGRAAVLAGHAQRPRVPAVQARPCATASGVYALYHRTLRLLHQPTIDLSTFGSLAVSVLDDPPRCGSAGACPQTAFDVPRTLRAAAAGHHPQT